MLHPEAFMRIAGGVFAKGRDPYFAPWEDVLQLNASSPALRDAAAETVIAIGDQCDGLRCDMAMLMTNEVFACTWGDRAGPPLPFLGVGLGGSGRGFSPCLRDLGGVATRLVGHLAPLIGTYPFEGSSQGGCGWTGARAVWTVPLSAAPPLLV